MRVLGRSPETTYEQLGLFRLTVGRFERFMRNSGFETVYQRAGIKRRLAPLRQVPMLRELFISEVVGVYRNPGGR